MYVKSVISLVLFFTLKLVNSKQRSSFNSINSINGMSTQVQLPLNISYKYVQYCVELPNKESGETDNEHMMLLKEPMYDDGKTRLHSKRRLNHTSVDCSTLSSIPQLLKDVQCKPRETLLDITVPKGIEILPKKVLVKMCGGHCNSRRHCVSTKNSLKTFRIQAIPTSNKPQCFEYSVQEHESCKCMCKKNKSNCTKQQKFDDRTCSCVCSPPIDSCPPNMIWSKRHCKCVCMKKRPCTTGTLWDNNSCKCKRQQPTK